MLKGIASHANRLILQASGLENLFKSSDQWVILLLIVIPLLIAIAQVMFKKGVSKDKNTFKITYFFDLRNIVKNYLIFGGLFVYAVSLLLYFIVLSKKDLSQAYPALALNFVFVPLFSKIFLNEKFSLKKALGFVLIIAGIVMCYTA